jgi:hypothetical protein
MISQTYHMPGSLDQFLITWMLLSLPVVYLMRSVTSLLVYLAGITSWSFTANDDRSLLSVVSGCCSPLRTAHHGVVEPDQPARRTGHVVALEFYHRRLLRPEAPPLTLIPAWCGSPYMRYSPHSCGWRGSRYEAHAKSAWMRPSIKSGRTGIGHHRLHAHVGGILGRSGSGVRFLVCLGEVGTSHT